jgi:hypothetical protein
MMVQSQQNHCISYVAINTIPYFNLSHLSSLVYTEVLTCPRFEQLALSHSMVLSQNAQMVAFKTATLIFRSYTTTP